MKKKILTRKRPVILNSEGIPIRLNAMEQRMADYNQNQIKNQLGFDIDITTLTTVVKKVSLQKFFTLPPADYLPIRVGEGAWSDILQTYVSFELADSFEKGIVSQAVPESRLATADAGVESVPVQVNIWAKEISWNIVQLNQASKSGNWDLVTAKEKSRKRNWDLGIQKIAFLGSSTNANIQGLLNQTGVTNNTTTITAPLSTLSTTNLKTFLTTVLKDYRVNCNHTAWPTHFVIPESDYLGLAAPASDTFPIKATLELLLETFRVMTGNPDFQVLSCAYGDNSVGGLGVQRYALYNGTEEETLRMDIPVDYTNTLASTVNGFSYHNVGFGQFTGAKAYRQPELLYYSF